MTVVAGLAVVGMDELTSGPRQHDLGRVAEQALERGIDALEVAVEPGDAQQIHGQLEDAVGLALGPLTSPLQLGEGAHRVVHAAHELGPPALEGGDVGAVVEPIVLDGHVHRADLLGEAFSRDVQVAKRRRDLPDLVAAPVRHIRRDLSGRQHPCSRGDLSERPRDRSAQQEAEAGDEYEHAHRRAHRADGAGTRGVEIRRRRRRQLAGGVALQATQRTQARPGRGQPPPHRHAPLDALRLADHHLPHALHGRARRLGQQRVQLGDETRRGVLAEVVERVGLHDDPAHSHRRRPTKERGGLRDALHLGRLDRLHQRDVGVRRPAGCA